MSVAGIVANPASGRDIRRLVAHASVFDNHEKVNIVRRVLLALDALGVARAVIMPDSFGLGYRALDGIELTSLAVDFLDMPLSGGEGDSTLAARRLAELGAGCLVVLGGDGTNRAVAKACGDVPLMPISTGTNNVFPVMVEGTVAGLAAGLVARGLVHGDAVIYRAKRLEVFIDGEMVDIALIDVVTSAERFIGTRALWMPGSLRDVVLSQAEPGQIGLSSVGACLQTVSAREPRGLHVRLGEGGHPVLAPIGPGLVTMLPVQAHRSLAIGEEVELDPAVGTIALDGERAIETHRATSIRVRLSDAGPRVVDIHTCLAQATQRGVFTTFRRGAIRS